MNQWKQMNGSMNEWKKKWIEETERMNEWMKKWINERMKYNDSNKFMKWMNNE